MLARLSAFVIWALVAATAAYWGLHLWARSPGVPPNVVTVADAGGARTDLGRLLGVAASPASAVAMPAADNARFHLLGVVAPGPNGQAPGVALIAVDGKLPKAYAVGATLDGQSVLKSVGLRSADISTGDAATPSLHLELPAAAPAATGALPRAEAEQARAAAFGPNGPVAMQRRMASPVMPGGAPTALPPPNITPAGSVMTPPPTLAPAMPGESSTTTGASPATSPGAALQPPRHPDPN